MLLETLSDIVAIKGKVATDIKENRPSLTSSLLVFIAGVIYGLVVFHFKSKDMIGEPNYYYLVFVILLGFLYMVASQIGITLLLWAMCRIFKGTSPFMSLFSAVGYSFLPYGALVAIIAFYHGTSFSRLVLAVMVLACFILFVYALTRVIHLKEDFSLQKSFMCVAFCLIFFGSFVHLFGY